MAVLKIIQQPSRSALSSVRAGSLTAPASIESANVSLMDEILYRGRQDRMERYKIYDGMDRDIDVARALDMIAEHCTNKDPGTELPFKFELNEDEITSDDSDILSECLRQWNTINGWKRMLYRTVRNVVKYGDAFFIRDPRTFKLHAVPAKDVAGIYVDKNTREIKAYHFVNLNFLIPAVMDLDTQTSTGNIATYAVAASGRSPQEQRHAALVNAVHVVHLTMSEGQHNGGNGQNDDIWPFGESFLEQAYNDFRKRDLLESGAVIHRIQRAPTRRVWNISVGKMRPDKVSSYMKRLKDELLHKRIPSRTGGTDKVDSIYNPISQMEDIWIPVPATGTPSTVTNLEGQQWNGLEDLEYFTGKVLRGLRVPTSFMLGPEEGGAQVQDGRVGTAYIQELQFSRFCQRIQDLLSVPFDDEFKLFLKMKGFQVHSADYTLTFPPPISFEEYREGALDSERLNRMTQASGMSFMSKQFVMEKFGRMTKTEILRNETLWMQENLPARGRQEAQDAEIGGMNVGASSFSGANFGPGPSVEPEGEDQADLGDLGGVETAGTGPQPLSGPGAAAGAEIGAGAGAGAGAGSGAGAGLTEALMEDKEDRSKHSNIKDSLFWTGHGDQFGNDSEPPKLTLRHIRKLRLEKERSRRELVKRLNLVARMYGGDGGSRPF